MRIKREEVAGLAVWFIFQMHTIDVPQIGVRAPWDFRDLHATVVDVLVPERVDIHSQCGTVLDGCRFVSLEL